MRAGLTLLAWLILAIAAWGAGVWVGQRLGGWPPGCGEAIQLIREEAPNPAEISRDLAESGLVAARVSDRVFLIPARQVRLCLRSGHLVVEAPGEVSYFRIPEGFPVPERPRLWRTQP